MYNWTVTPTPNQQLLLVGTSQFCWVKSLRPPNLGALNPNAPINQQLPGIVVKHQRPQGAGEERLHRDGGGGIGTALQAIHVHLGRWEPSQQWGSTSILPFFGAKKLVKMDILMLQKMEVKPARIQKWEHLHAIAI